MAKGEQPQSQTVSTTTQPSKEAEQLLKLAMPSIRQFAAKPPKLPKGPLTAPVQAEQTQGQQMALDQAQGGNLSQVVDRTKELNDFLSGDVLRPDTNPALREWMAAATQPITDTLLSQQLPALRSGAVAAGGFGGSRQGIAEGLANRGASQAIGATTANIANAGYGQGLDALTKAFALAPQTAQLQLMPATTTSAVGDVKQSQAQSVIDERNYRRMFKQILPLLMGQQIAGIASGLPGGTTSSTGDILYPQQNPLMSGLGGAMSGASLGSALFPGVGTAAGGGIGALLGILGAL